MLPLLQPITFIISDWRKSEWTNEVNPQLSLLSPDQHLLHRPVCLNRRQWVLVDWLAVGQQPKRRAGSAVRLHPPLRHHLQLVPGRASTWERLPGHDRPLKFLSTPDHASQSGIFPAFFFSFCSSNSVRVRRKVMLAGELATFFPHRRGSNSIFSAPGGSFQMVQPRRWQGFHEVQELSTSHIFS